MQRDDDVYVGHMLDLSRKVAAKITGVPREKFDEDENLRLALAHLLQTIGEAARRVSREYQKAHPEIPWAGSSECATRSFTTTWTLTRTSSGRLPSRRFRSSSPRLSRSSGADRRISGPCHETFRKGHHRAPATIRNPPRSTTMPTAR